MRALDLIDTSRGPVSTGDAKCVETGEVFTVRAWADAISKKTGSKSRGVQIAILKAMRTGAPYLGLRFVRVAKDVAP